MSSSLAKIRLGALALGLSFALIFPASGAFAASGEKKVETKAVHTPAIPKPGKTIKPSAMEVMIDKSVPVSFTKPAATVFIANPDIADVQVLTPQSVMVYGKKAGQTTLIVTDNTGAQQVYRTIIVSQNLADLREALRTVIPGSQIKVESIPNGIVLSGEAKDASAVEDARRLAARYIPEQGGDIINRIRVKANNQVQIRVRFAEVAKDVDKRFGINWETIGNVGQFVFGMGTGADFINPATTALYDRTALDGLTNNAIAGSFTNSHFNINSMIDALAKDGFVTILAEPSLTAMSGETASFLAGGEFPIPVPQSTNTVTIEWKQYGVSLAFTPTIISDSRINLHVRPEVSQLTDIGAITLSSSSNNFSVPALTTRRAETTIELNSGQSFAIAGLLNSQQTQAVSKFPLLGDMPILGPLFRSSRFQNNESELVIIITPYVVKPTTEENLSLPTDGYALPSDADRLWRMRHTNSDPSAKPLSGQPRAELIENPINEEPALPTAAPATPVYTQPSAEKTVAPTPPAALSRYPQSQPAPLKPLKAKTTEGHGGFIVE
ncbi:MAG: pilus assembly protein N-terminal domain-containing protein [Alphaproteobacteria bacterium]|nr:pilus assembly protein N-terminal domain-containing protein [Alphaproteobacteria bacterium]